MISGLYEFGVKLNIKLSELAATRLRGIEGALPKERSAARVRETPLLNNNPLLNSYSCNPKSRTYGSSTRVSIKIPLEVVSAAPTFYLITEQH